MNDSELATNAETRRAFLKRLLKAHEGYYNVKPNFVYRGRAFEGFAEFSSESSQYVLIKRAKLWEAHTHEYLFFHGSAYVDAAELDELIAFMTSDATCLVEPEPHHMTSYVSLVIVADAVEAGVEQAVRKTRFRKNLKFGLAGWIDLRLAIVDLSSGTVTTNGQGKSLKATLQANLNPTVTE